MLKRQWHSKHPFRAGVVVGLAALALAACGEDLDDATSDDADAAADEADDDAADDDAAGDATGDDREGWPDTITYGVLPAEDADTLAARYEPFEEYMAACLDHDVELFTGTSYTAMLEAMRTGSIDIAKFGPFAYILGNERSDAQAFVQGVNDASVPTYKSYIVTLESSGFESVADLEGESFAFVDPGSASGHLFPRAFMVDELGITNDEIEDVLGEIVFAGDHDAVGISVLNGDVAAGALSDTTWLSLQDAFADHENMDEFVILTETADIPRSPEALRGDLPQSFKDEAERCFLEASDQPELTEFLESHRYHDGFVSVDDAAYDVVRDTASALGMSPDDLLE